MGIGINYAVPVVFVLHSEIRGRKWIVRPVHQTRGKPVVLSNRQPLPIVFWSVSKERNSLLLKQPEHGPLVTPNIIRCELFVSPHFWNEGICFLSHASEDYGAFSKRFDEGVKIC